MEYIMPNRSEEIRKFIDQKAAEMLNYLYDICCKCNFYTKDCHGPSYEEEGWSCPNHIILKDFQKDLCNNCECLGLDCGGADAYNPGCPPHCSYTPCDNSQKQIDFEAAITYTCGRCKNFDYCDEPTRIADKPPICPYGHWFKFPPEKNNEE